VEGNLEKVMEGHKRNNITGRMCKGVTRARHRKTAEGTECLKLVTSRKWHHT